MAEKHVSTGPPIARKPRRYQVDEGLDVRFLRHANSAHVLQTLWRGLSGDWGDVPEADARENEFAVQGEYRVLSSYPVGESRVWIITEADRSATTIMLPGEYYSVRQKHWPYRRM